MATSVYLSNENIVVVTGKASEKNIRITSFDAIKLLEGTVINGMVINDEAVRAHLIHLRSNGILPKKNVRLVIDRSSVLVKFLKIPKMNKKNILSFVENSFSGAAKSRNELIYDYSVIESSQAKENGNLILGTAIEKAFVEDYVHLFTSACIQLNSIDIALNSIIKFQRYFDEYKNKNFITSFVDAENIFSLLFINGKYSFSNRYRLISKRGTPESIAELSSFLSSIIQFNMTQKNNSEIEFAIFCGLHECEDGLCSELSNNLNIKVMPLTECSQLVIDKRIAEKKPEILNNFFAVANLI